MTEVSAFFTYTIGTSDRKEDMDLTFGELSLTLFPTPGTDQDPDRGKTNKHITSMHSSLLKPQTTAGATEADGWDHS